MLKGSGQGNGISMTHEGTVMASESERVTIRIPPDKINRLQALVKSGEFSTISDAIRAAIDRFIDQQFAPDYIRKMTIELPKGNVVDLQQLVRSGDSVSVEDAIRNAVREYVRRRVSKAIEKSDE
jgi:Arc/MetJ-type ribon-helix-helix transcriptional regulator